MASSTPSRSFDSSTSLPDTRFRSLSLSSTSRASDVVVRESVTRRSQTPKATRKYVSNRSKPYTSPALSRTRQSGDSTTAVVNNNPTFDDKTDLTSIDVNIDNLLSQQTQLNQQQQHAFERSTDDEKEVWSLDIICMRVWAWVMV